MKKIENYVNLYYLDGEPISSYIWHFKDFPVVFENSKAGLYR